MLLQILLNEIYFAESDIVNDSDFHKRLSEVINSSSLTTYALVVANLLDATLREYANAIVTDIISLICPIWYC